MELETDLIDSAETANEPGRGRDAMAPTEIPVKGWKDILSRVRFEVKHDRVMLLSAATAFHALPVNGARSGGDRLAVRVDCRSILNRSTGRQLAGHSTAGSASPGQLAVGADVATPLPRFSGNGRSPTVHPGHCRTFAKPVTSTRCPSSTGVSRPASC